MTQRIVLEEPRAAGFPVVKRTALGQTFKGAILKAESRDRLRPDDNGVLKPILKDDGSGRHSQELVVHCLTLPGTTSPVGLGEDNEHLPEPGEIVRLILKGKAFGDWIEAKRGLPSGTVAVGDVVTQITNTAQVYEGKSKKSGGEITDQAKVDEARARSRTVGIYGPLTLSVPEQDSEWTSKAVAAYNSLQEQIPAERAVDISYEASNDTWSASPSPSKPDSLPQAAWDSLTPEAKAQVAKTMNDEPPF